MTTPFEARRVLASRLESELGKAIADLGPRAKVKDLVLRIMPVIPTCIEPEHLGEPEPFPPVLSGPGAVERLNVVAAGAEQAAELLRALHVQARAQQLRDLAAGTADRR